MTTDEALASIRSLCVELVEGARAPYEIGREVWGIAFRHADEADSLSGLWLLWGALTDWVDVEPRTTEEAEWRGRAGGPEQAMRDAARGWLEVEASQGDKAEYLDHWLYEVIGYERPLPLPPTRP